MTKLRVRMSQSTYHAERSATNAASGAFETSAPNDAQAAQIRNVTLLSSNVGRQWNLDHAGTPVNYPGVMDRPED
jgi:hypothetical protein